MSHLSSLAKAGQLATNSNIKFIFIHWLDYMAQLRSRWLPVAYFEELLQSGGGKISISQGNLGTTQNDHMSSICDPVGTIFVEPDLASMRPFQTTGPIKNAATIMAHYVNEQGSGLPTCPRSALQHIISEFQSSHNITFLIGFEIEITFCRRNPSSSSEAKEIFTPIDTVHAWGTLSDEQYKSALPLLISITRALQNIGISIQQFHSEAGAGQYEFVLPPLPPIQAIDTLIQAKQCIQLVAADVGLRATCYPMPFAGIGTAAHAHVSFHGEGLKEGELRGVEESFVSGLLGCLPAVCAVGMSQGGSYGRVVDDGWTGGRWVAW